MTVLKVAGFPIESQWRLVHPKGKPLSPLARVFQQHLLLESAKWVGKDG